MSTTRSVAPVSVVRAYFALQAVAGVGWWAAVFVSPDVRNATLGQWNPAVVIGPDLVLFVGTSAWAALGGNRIAAIVSAVWTTVVTLALGVYGLVQQEAGWGIVLMAVSTLGTVAAATTMWFGSLPTGWFFVGPFAFRVADEAPSGHHLRRSLMQLVVFWTVFFVVVPLALTTVENRLRLHWPVLETDGVRVAGAVGLILGSAVGLWSCVTMARRGEGTPLPAATARELVISGPYRFVRNPMAIGGLLQTAGVGLILASWLVIVVAVAGALLWNVMIRPTEEADLAVRFGDPYRRYATHVRCWVPTSPWSA